MDVSVVLCSYNGEKYITEQLESLRNQTKRIDEVLIFDDKSTDNTVQVVNAYIQKHNLTDWKVTVNNENRGWMRNFIDGLQQASGQIIFPCDQDDIWNSDKIEKMSKEMASNSQIQVLVSNYEALYEGDEHRKISGVFAKGVLNNKECRQLLADEKGVYILRPGCTMAVRREFLNMAIQYWFTGYAHDALLWRTAIFMDGLFLLDESLITFRRHNENVSDKKNHQKAAKLDNINYHIHVIDELIRMCREQNKPEKLTLLNKIKRFWKTRQKFYITHSLVLWLKMIVLHFKYYLTLKAALGDVYIVLKG